jgi:hypothetical protein
MGHIVRRRRAIRGRVALRLGLVALMMGSVFVLSAAPAMAACTVTDLTCVTQTVSDPVTTATDTTTEVVDTANETVGAVKDQVDQTVQPVTDTVKGILDQAPDPPDPTGILPDLLGSMVEQPSGAAVATQSGSNLASTGPAGVDPRTRDGVAASSFGAGSVIDLVATPLSSTQDVSTTISPGGFFDRFPLAIEAAKRLAFPLALALIVLLFVAVQNRIDRKDPKLALAPVAPDLLRFE